MERTRFRAAHRTLIALSLVTAAFVPGCVSTLDQARTAWADGEGDFERAEPLYRDALADPKEGEYAKEELYEAYIAMGDRHDRKKAKLAEGYYRKAYELDPKGEEALAGLARALRDLFRLDEAIAFAEQGAAAGYTNSKRLLAVMLIQRGDARMQAQQWQAAEEDYSRAIAVLPDVSVALGLVRARLALRNLEGAAEALITATPLVAPNDINSRQQFLELRQAVVAMAIEGGKVELADRLVDLAPAGVPPEEQLAIALDISMAMARAGKPDLALARMTGLVDAVKGGKITLEPGKAGEVNAKVAALYVGRAGIRLGDGDLAGALADADAALKLRPGDPAATAQRAIALGAQGQSQQAMQALQSLPADNDARKRAAALLGALEVEGLVSKGQIDAATEALKQAKANSADLPAVRVASARLLLRTPARGLRKNDSKEVRSTGLVSYPEGEVTRVAEALSELDWSRRQLAGLGPTYPYRLPNTPTHIESLEQEIRKFYPYSVTFQGEPTAQLVLKSESGAPVDVVVEGAGWRSKVQASKDGGNVTVPKPGLVRLTYRGSTATFVAEPYTRVELPL